MSKKLIDRLKTVEDGLKRTENAYNQLLGQKILIEELLSEGKKDDKS